MSDWSLPEGWDVKTLGEVAQVVSGSTPSRENPDYWHNGTIPWATPTDITRDGSRVLHSTADRITHKGLHSSGARLLPPGSLLMTSRATLGEIKIAGTQVCTNQGFKSLVPNDSIDPWYLFYQMQLAKPRYSALGIGSTFLEVNKKGTESFEIPYAPQSEQRKIAEILTTVDRLIERTEALIAKYQAIKQGMMHDLFTRGVDSHGRLRPPHAEAPELYKESELGWIPKEWRVESLFSVVPRAEYGVSVPMTEVGEGVPVLRMNNLRDGGFDLSQLKFSKRPEAVALLIRVGDVLFNRTNSFEHVGRTSIWRAELEEASFASYLVRLIPDLGRITPVFLTMWLNLPSTQLTIRQCATPGVHQVNINPTNLRQTRVALPHRIEEQERITQFVERCNGKLAQDEAFLGKMRLVKTGLMQDLLTGKVRVKVDDSEEAHADG